MEQREKSVGADVSAIPELPSDTPERHRARAVAVERVERAVEVTSRTIDTSVGARARESTPKGKKSAVRKNRLRETRIEKMMSKAELARRANLSVLTIDRVEKGLGCRMDTKRKILEALGMSLADRVRVFGEEE
jgi:DNA-binding XRE family transcriptional regulator